ncbi:MAG TPA: hypothetical protein VFI65_06670 [Streptosporangiaceae bacterium]|nr:hypothetical protein [Streptosporangiaceae bacterium]
MPASPRRSWCEQQLRAELRAESELITEGSLRQLDFGQADDRASAHPFSGQLARSGRGRQRLAWLAPIAAAASVAVIVATAAVVSHQGPSRGQQPGGAGLLTAGQITGITALSPSDVWAVGYLATRPDQIEVPLIEHWNGTKWQRMAVPKEPGGGDAQLSSIAGTSSRSLWAVGSGDPGPGADKPVILHWDGRSWRSQPFAASTRAGILNAVVVRSASDAWAVGQRGEHDIAPLILHWDGSTWDQVPAPAEAGGTLLSVTAISARNVWVAGFTDRKGLAALLLRWNGRAWQQTAVRHQGPSSDAVSAIAALSPRNIWAAGGPVGPNNVILHWNGTIWTRITSPGTTFLGGVNDLAATSASDIWTAGYRGTFYAGVPQILHWNGSKWSRSFGPASTKGLHEYSSSGPTPPAPSPRQQARHHPEGSGLSRPIRPAEASVSS